MSPSGLGIGAMDEIDFVAMKSEAMMHNYMALFSVTIVLWEWIIALRDEVRFIWRCRSQKTRVTYLFARYFAIGYLSVNVFLSFRWTSRFPLSKSMCLRWYAQHTTAFTLQYVASHVTLLRRVLDLNTGRDVALTFGALHLAELVGTIFSAKGSLTGMNFDPTCHALAVPKDVFLFLVLFVTGQFMIWTLIVRGIWRSDRRNSGTLDFSAKVFRIWSEGDGKAVWAVCFVGMIFHSLDAFARQQTEPTHFFGWPIGFLSIATCRFILSTEKQAYIRSRFSRLSSKGKERAVDQPDDTEDGIEIITTVSPPGNPGHLVFARNTRSQSSVSMESSAWNHPMSLRSLTTITSITSEPPAETATEVILHTDAATEVVLHTSPTNSSYERRRSRSMSLESQRTVQTEITAPSRGLTRTPSNTSTHIEISSMHTTSSMNSEELREFWNETWDGDRTAHQVGSFIA